MTPSLHSVVVAWCRGNGVPEVDYFRFCSCHLSAVERFVQAKDWRLVPDSRPEVGRVVSWLLEAAPRVALTARQASLFRRNFDGEYVCVHCAEGASAAQRSVLPAIRRLSWRDGS